MRIANETPTPDLSPIVTWQYDKADNLQHLIWKKEYVSSGSDSDSSGTELEQTGICQRMCENVAQFESDFHKYIFDAVNLAIREDVDSWTDGSREKNLVTFGLTLWSRMVGGFRPRHTTSPYSYVRLKTWAKLIKAVIFKLQMNGSLFDVIRYVNILMPEIGIAVSDGGLNGDQLGNEQKMTISYSFATEEGKSVDAGSSCSTVSPYVSQGATVSIAIKIEFTVNTSTNSFSGVSVAPIMTITNEDGESTLHIGSVENCIQYGVGAAAWFGVDDLRQQLPQSARSYLSHRRIIVDTSISPPKIYLQNPDSSEARVEIPLDSLVETIKDQNGNVVDYVFSSSSDPLQGLPNWNTYKARQFPEYEEILNMGKDAFPYPAGVGDGNSQFELKSGNGQYLGLAEPDEVSTVASFKYTLDRSVLFPAEYDNPPANAWTEP